MQRKGKHIVILLAAATLLAPSLAPAAKGGKGKGGGEETTTGCLTYSDRSLVDEIQSDGFDPAVYCHGTDGQVTVPTLLRHDLKKFNDNGRVIIVVPRCWGGETVAVGTPCFGSDTAEARILQSRGEGNPDGTYAGNDLKFQEMREGDVTRVSLDFDLGRQVHVYFGNGSFINDSTQTCGPYAQTSARPAWVRCEAEEGNPTDGYRCTEWTVSSDDLRDAPPEPPDNARACLVKYKGGTQILDGNVEADFEFYLIAQ
jgi:hypothetical protein